MKTIEITDISKYIQAAPNKMCCMFIGDTGIGKTQVINKYAKDNGLYLKTLILSQLEASETLGIPVQTTREFNGKIYNCIETAIPTWVFELAEHKDAMLYLDEFLCAEPSVMNAFLNFLTERRVGDIDLSHVKVVASTNIGNYTYEPDNNILSRFCMFYCVNTHFGSYIERKHHKIITNDYADNEPKAGVIFDSRSLKPRCHELLAMVKDNTLLNDFYEGFTNTAYRPTFHGNPKIDSVVTAYAVNDSGTWKIPSDCYDALASLLYTNFISTSSKKNKIEFACRYMGGLQYDKNRLMDAVERIINSTTATI